MALNSTQVLEEINIPAMAGVNPSLPDFPTRVLTSSPWASSPKMSLPFLSIPHLQPIQYLLSHSLWVAASSCGLKHPRLAGSSGSNHSLGPRGFPRCRQTSRNGCWTHPEISVDHTVRSFSAGNSDSRWPRKGVHPHGSQPLPLCRRPSGGRKRKPHPPDGAKLFAESG